jgi:mono/diheme cytochrome c family protein
MRPILLLAVAAFCLSSSLAQAGDAAAGETRFKQLCASCHGPAGKGDGPAAAALNPKPRNFSDAAWQASVDDQYLRDIITKGGAAMGKSPLMAPFGASVKDAQLDDVVAYLRSLKE